jgi:hypothetical protein
MLTSASLVTRNQGFRNFRNFRNSQQNWQRNLGKMQEESRKF